MKTYKKLYPKIYSFENLYVAYRKARKGKTKKDYVKKFEEHLEVNLLDLQLELKTKTFKPRPLDHFILKDPKTRKISRSHFRDRIIHHALINVIRTIFEKRFIHDSCANQLGKGNLFAVKRFERFRRKITRNFRSFAFCLKADIKHYFQEVNHEILINILKKKIADNKVIWLVKKILNNPSRLEEGERNKGMPLGNLTSQFFANVYLNELDYFVKHELRAKYYIRYVDDFVVLHKSKKKLEEWKEKIEIFLEKKLKIELHPEKSKVFPLSKGIDFVGFRNFYHFRLLRKRNVRNINQKVSKYKEGIVSNKKIIEIFQGWNAYAKWANSYKIRKRMLAKINNIINKRP